MTATIVKSLLAYIRDDKTAKYGLKEPAYLTVIGDGVKLPCEVDCGVLHIKSNDANSVTLSCDQFAPDEELWNGPDIIPNNLRNGSFEASLWHDLIWGYAGEIAEQTGMTVAAVKQWGNDIFYSAWCYYASLYGSKCTLFARLAYWAVSIAKRWYGKVKTITSCFLLAALVGGCSGCYTPPDWRVTDGSEIRSEEGIK